MSSSYFLEFFIASAAIILVPGPSVMFTIARAVSWGKSTAFLTVLGNAAGMFILSVLVAFGIGPVLQSSTSLLAAVQLAGGMYLAYLGFEAIKNRKLHADDIVALTEAKPAALKNLRQGFMVGLLNPKAIVFIAAIFPQFVDPHGAAISTQLLFFGAVWCVLAIVGDGLWAIIVGSSRDWFVTSSNRLITLRTLGGVVMMALGMLVVIPVLLNI